MSGPFSSAAGGTPRSMPPDEALGEAPRGERVGVVRRAGHITHAAALARLSRAMRACGRLRECV